MPLGLHFDDDAVVKKVQEDSQASRVSIEIGWKACILDGASVGSTHDLVAKVQALKAQGVAKVSITFKTISSKTVSKAGAEAKMVPRAAHSAPLIKRAPLVANDADAKDAVPVAARFPGLAASLAESIGRDLAALRGQRSSAASVSKTSGLPSTSSTTSSSSTATAMPSTANGGSSGKTKPLAKEELSFDLRQPLGIFFDDDLSVTSMQAGSQAVSLGVKPGWRACSVGYERVSSVKNLVAMVQALKEKGEAKAWIGFFLPIVPHEEKQPVLAAAPTAVGSNASAAASIRFDLSQPLGIFFDTDGSVKDVPTGAQASNLGVKAGWRVREVSGESVSTTQELVAAIKELKEHGITTATLTFDVPLAVPKPLDDPAAELEAELESSYLRIGDVPLPAAAPRANSAAASVATIARSSSPLRFGSDTSLAGFEKADVPSSPLGTDVGEDAGGEASSKRPRLS